VSTWTYNDGGRAAAGYKGTTRDCVTRAIAIATGLPYQHVYDLVIEAAKAERPRGRTARSRPRTGVHKQTARRVLADLGWRWVPTMSIGSGTTVHLRADELPAGRVIVSISRHVVAVIDGVIQDTHDPARGGTRAVYGYFTQDPE
jgi:hypothetical protein